MMTARGANLECRLKFLKEQSLAAIGALDELCAICLGLVSTPEKHMGQDTSPLKIGGVTWGV